MGLVDPSPAFRRLDRFRLASPQIFDNLREMIISLELPPGTVLSRGELQKKFGTSQTPIRDAFMRLEEEGLVEVFPQHATKVSSINLRLAQQALFLRLSLEQEAVRRMTLKRDEALLAKLNATVEQQEELALHKDFVEFSTADRDFHRQIFEAADIPALWDLVRRRSGHNDRLHQLHLPLSGRSTQIVRDHRRIVDAMRDGDADAAQVAVREHVSRSLSNIEEIRSSYRDFVTD